MKTSTRFLILVFVLGVVSLFFQVLRGKTKPAPLPSPTATSTVMITDTPGGRPTPTSLPTRPFTPAETPLIPHQCDLKYPSAAEGQGITFIADKPMLLQELYTKTYGTPRDNYDLYAVVYFNNRKALENNSYNAIDPYYLSVEKNWVIFLPPMAWINGYRDFPMPVLYPINLDGTNLSISLSGTSILYPLSLQISNCFENMTNFHVSVNSNSTATGLFDYCRGVADIFSASVNDFSSVAVGGNRCQGVQFMNFEIARYAVVIFTNSKNTYANDMIAHPLNQDELRKLLFSAKFWSDVRNTWNAEPISRYFPSPPSGTFETVKNKIFPSWNVDSPIPNLDNTEDSKVLINQVIANNYSIGFAGYNDYQTNRESLRAIPVDNISPNPDTIGGSKPSYPLTQQLDLYIGGTLYSQSPLVKYFVHYYLTYEFDFIDKLGYFKPSKYGFLNNPDTFP